MSIIDLSGDIKRAKAERDQAASQQQENARAFAAQALEKFRQEQAEKTAASQAMEKFKAEAEQKRKAQEQRQENKQTHPPTEKTPDKGHSR